MERSDRLIKFTALIVLLAIIVYAAYSYYAANTGALRTAAAVEGDIRESVMTEGFAVRDETVLTSSLGVAVLADEGSKVAVGAGLAVTYADATERERAEEIRDLAAQLESLNAIASGGSARTAKESVLALTRVIAEGDLSELDAALLGVNTYIIGADSSSDEASATIDRLTARLTALQNSVSSSALVRAEKSGTFSTAVDGYEGVSPRDIRNRLTVKEAEALFNSPKTVPGAFGKLINGIKWYYVTVMDAEYANRLSSMTSVRVDFSKTYSASVTMTVESVGEEEDGKCAVVLSCSRYLQDIAAVREMTAEIVFTAQSGIRIPKAAVHLDAEGGTFIYLLSGLQADAKGITIIGEDGDYYVIERTSDIKTGAEIIISAANLRDGAVVTSN